MATSEQNDSQIDGSGDNLSQTNEAFANMMKNIVNDGTNESLCEADATDEEILHALEDVEVTEVYGPPITGHVAEAFNKTGLRKLSKETEDRLKGSFKIPDNCRSFRVPRVNPEIWQNLQSRSKVTDLKWQQVQGGLSVALTVLASVSDKIAQAASMKVIPKDLAGELLKLGLDGANLVGHQMQEITMKRRMDIRPHLNPDYGGICTAEIASSEFLFGNNLTETLRSSKAASTVIRNSTLSRSRMVPYSYPQKSSSLNFQRPFHSSRGRWNGQRQQRGTYNRQFNQPRAQTGHRPRY